MKNVKSKQLEWIEDINNKAVEYKLDIFEKKNARVKYLARYLDCTETQAILFALIFQQYFSSNRFDACISDVAEKLSCSALHFLMFSSDMELLVRKRLLVKSGRGRKGNKSTEFSFEIPEKVTRIITDGKNPEPLHKKTGEIEVAELIEQIHELVDSRSDRVISTQELLREVGAVRKTYKAHTFFKVFDIGNIGLEEIVFFSEMVYLHLDGEQYIMVDHISSHIFDTLRNKCEFRNRMLLGKSGLEKAGLLEFGPSVFSNDKTVYPSDKALDVIYRDNIELKMMMKQKDAKLIYPEKLIPKKLYYNPVEQIEIEKLFSFLDGKNLKQIKENLAIKSLSTGINILLYGPAGTGKTELVNQLSIKTNRPILSVDISECKSSWLGESEKIISRIFKDYQSLLDKHEKEPILFFNEADAILGKRFENVNRSVDQTMNAIQNILLESLENMKGIFIATTNMFTNLDKAFERRFLFKLKINKPEPETAAKIWLDKLQWLNHDEAMRLTEYSLSGGMIENIARKSVMNEVLTGEQVNFEQILMFCKQEKMETVVNNNVIGFRRN